MTSEQLELLKYPIGKMEFPKQPTAQMQEEWIADITAFPGLLTKLVENLSQKQLETPYRPEGWTLRQLVHHCADSHTHAYLRFKWTLSEEKPVIKAYDEKKFLIAKKLP